MRNKTQLLVLFATTMLTLGCGQEQAAQTPAPGDSAAGGKYLLTSEPQDAEGVIAFRDNAQDGDEVVVVGRIGGSEDPWVEGRAAFTIVDPLLQACSDKEDDPCPTPWDYCCETDRLPKATVLVKLIDDSGKLVASDARELLQLKELQTVVVQGKAKRDDAGTLAVMAEGIWVKP